MRHAIQPIQGAQIVRWRGVYEPAVFTSDEQMVSEIDISPSAVNEGSSGLRAGPCKVLRIGRAVTSRSSFVTCCYQELVSGTASQLLAPQAALPRCTFPRMTPTAPAFKYQRETEYLFGSYLTEVNIQHPEAVTLRMVETFKAGRILWRRHNRALVPSHATRALGRR